MLCVHVYVLAMVVLLTRIIAKKLKHRKKPQTVVQPLKLYDNYKVLCVWHALFATYHSPMKCGQPEPQPCSQAISCPTFLSTYLTMPFELHEAWFKGHICGHESRAGDGLGMRLHFITFGS